MVERRNFKDKLDETDLTILRILQRSGRITNVDLAREIRLSPPTALQRVRRLEMIGLIREYVALLDADKLGFSLTVMVQVSISLSAERALERFVDCALKLAEVQEVHNVSGEFDYLLKVVVRDMGEYERFIREKLSAIPGVGRIQSCFVLSTPKHCTSYAV